MQIEEVSIVSIELFWCLYTFLKLKLVYDIYVAESQGKEVCSSTCGMEIHIIM